MPTMNSRIQDLIDAAQQALDSEDKAEQIEALEVAEGALLDAIELLRDRRGCWRWHSSKRP